MMAMNKKILEQEPGDIEALLPWHAAGTLSARDTRRVEDALARDPSLGEAVCGDPGRIRRNHRAQ